MRLAETRSKKSLSVNRRESGGKQLPEVKLDCRLPDGRFCAKCCYNTEMPLTEEDIERIERLGYKRDYFVIVGEDGIPRLRNVNGHCVFLDEKTGRCKIYSYRPLGCRLYPLVYVPGVGVTVDRECPKASVIPESVIRKYAKYVIELVRKIYGDIV